MLLGLWLFTFTFFFMLFWSKEKTLITLCFVIWKKWFIFHLSQTVIFFTRGIRFSTYNKILCVFWCQKKNSDKLIVCYVLEKRISFNAAYFSPSVLKYSPFIISLAFLLRRKGLSKLLFVLFIMKKHSLPLIVQLVFSLVVLKSSPFYNPVGFWSSETTQNN